MRVCTVCGAEHDQDAVRCNVCHALLPELDVSDSPLPGDTYSVVKICNKCGHENCKTAIRCEKCHSFLNDARKRIKESDEQSTAPVLMQINTGETLTLVPGQIIGRQYQPKLWDVYTPKAAYKLGFSNKKYVLENLKDSSVIPISFGKEYRIGRKTMVFNK